MQQGTSVPELSGFTFPSCYYIHAEMEGLGVMKAKLYLLPLVFSALLTFSTPSTCYSALLTFDDIHTSTNYSDNLGIITNGYQGLNWVNFFVINAPLDADQLVTNGYYYGMVSASNVAFNGFGNPSEIDSVGTSFNFIGVYLTGAWNSNLNVEVQGFRGGSLMYDQIVVVAATNATLFTFDYMDIDRLYFNSFGGQNAGFPVGGGEQIAMDNLTFEFVPEPSSFLLTTAAALMLWPILRRKRA